MAEVFADRGEIVRCERGHEICTVRSRLFFGDIAAGPLQFHEWRQPEPHADDRLPLRCAECGAPYIKTINDHPRAGLQVHFDDGWRGGE